MAARGPSTPPKEGGFSQNRRNRPLYMISVAAQLTGMHPQTLRVYEAKGLVQPGRSRGNTRLYSQADIDRLNLIGELTAEGINLAGVVRILDMEEQAQEQDQEIDRLREQVRTLEREVHELKSRLRINELAPYDGKSPAEILRGLLSGESGR